MPDRLPIGKLRRDGNHRMLSHINSFPPPRRQSRPILNLLHEKSLRGDPHARTGLRQPGEVTASLAASTHNTALITVTRMMKLLPA